MTKARLPKVADQECGGGAICGQSARHVEVVHGQVLASPSAMARRVSPSLRYSSRIREIRNTS